MSVSWLTFVGGLAVEGEQRVNGRASLGLAQQMDC